jgi:hypothetical protein
LLFIRTAEDKLELLSEEYVPDEDAVKAAMQKVQERVMEAMREAGLPAKVHMQFAGAKKA